jgi:hypothetical protein
MNKNLIIACVAFTFFVVLLVSCKKDGLNSDEAKKIQYKWERISTSSATDYLDGRTVTWTVKPAAGTYLEFDGDGYYYDIYTFGSTKYQYAVDGNKILSLQAATSRATTPHYTDTAFINYVDDHLLVLFHRKYFSSGAYSYLNESIDSLKK